jgi:replicative DNA helicase
MATSVRRLASEGPPVGRVPPHNLEAEESVLGACLLSREAIANVVETVSPEDFYKPAHTQIFNAILSLYGRGEPVDAITLTEELRRTGDLEQLGGAPYIHTLVSGVPTAGSASYYARIVEEHALLRRLIEASQSIGEMAFGVPEDVAEAVDQAESLIYQVSRRRISEDFRELRGLLTENMELVEKLYERGSLITGLPSGFTELDEITAGFQPSNLVIVAARPSMGKCLAAGTLIDVPSGERVPVEELVKARYSEVYGLGDGPLVRRVSVSDWIDNGLLPCWKVTTRLGRSLDVTANHPLLTVEGWRELQDLAVGARIAVPRQVPTFGTDSWTPERVRLLAYFIAEGSLTGYSPGFTNTDAVLIRDFKRCVAKEFPDCWVRQHGLSYWVSRPRANGPVTGPNPVKAWLKELGLAGKTAHQKAFPDAVWRLDADSLAEFLRTLFSCDGTIYSMQGYPRIEFCVASEQLAKDVHHALTRFGIVARFRRKTVAAWNITITEPRSVNRYQELIGWVGEKSFRFPQTLQQRRSNIGSAPRETWAIVREAAAAREFSLTELARRGGVDGMAGGFNAHTARGISQSRLAAYATVLDEPRLKLAASPDLFWDEIASIEPVGPKRVFDLTVPEGSNFIAADVCVHNSSWAVTVAQHIAVTERQPVVIFSLEMSRMELVQRLMCAEARVDSNRLRRGALQDSDWPKLSLALGRLAEAPIFIDDTAQISVMEMRAKCRRLQAKHGLGLVIVDYLQLMQPIKRTDNRVQEISEISRSLKILARDLNVPVLAVSQLSRNVEYRSDKRPLLADLRDSGAIEQDSDLVIFIYRDEVYNPDSQQKGIAEIHVAKHRNGPIGKVELTFLEHYTKFADLAKGL